MAIAAAIQQRYNIPVQPHVICSGATVEDIEYIERGYQDLVGKLQALGADIRIVDEPEHSERLNANAG